MLPVRSDLIPSLFEEFFRDFPFVGSLSTELRTIPKINIAETEKAFEIEVAAPGYKKEDFKIELNDNTLTISSEKKEEKTEKGKDYHRREFNYSCFSRSFIVPDHVDADKIHAVYENGVLSVILPKKEEYVSKKNKTIEIK
ncbi:MAG: Hsp20/alpha crystallin family protein [Bacteroidales bacterium]|nr:Hsp20/alpha crystallin family protein [Bacteroidales bacterium]